MQNADFTATAVHYAVENEAREAIRKIDGTMPEDLPTPDKSIGQLQAEEKKRLESGDQITMNILEQDEKE